jgi:hypothetical protein
MVYCLPFFYLEKTMIPSLDVNNLVAVKLELGVRKLFNLGVFKRHGQLELFPQGARLRDVESALLRIEEGRYGLCCVCGYKIDKRRLQIVPETPVCYDCGSREIN